VFFGRSPYANDVFANKLIFLMTDNNLKRAVGTFPAEQDARSALMMLRDAGFDMDKISVVAQNPTGKSMGDIEVESSAKRAKGGAEAGAVMGATTGGILGLIGSLSVLAIPGVGIATEAAVLLGNALLGSGVGAAGGTLVGALVGWGIPEKEAVLYKQLLSQGSYIVLVEGTEAEVNGAEAILLNHQLNNWNVYDIPFKNNL
ncbi:MAG: hypothetical protein AAGK10_21570, partial [Cyanobacteria bacterium J06555_3]